MRFGEAVEEEALSDPGGDLASSELGRIVGHAAAGALKRESSLAPTADLAAQARSLLCEVNAAMFPHER